MNDDAVRRFAENHRDCERSWKDMSTTEQEWWRRRYERTQERIRKTMSEKQDVYRR